jgi:hypothetical protein
MWTCLGPQPLYLYDPYPQLWLRPMHQAYITPGETISRPHLLWKFQEVTVTVALPTPRRPVCPGTYMREAI